MSKRETSERASGGEVVRRRGAARALLWLSLLSAAGALPSSCSSSSDADGGGAPASAGATSQGGGAQGGQSAAQGGQGQGGPGGEAQGGASDGGGAQGGEAAGGAAQGGEGQGGDAQGGAGGGAAATYVPGKPYPAARDKAPRGLVDLRGLIHAHSVYSHDACDNEPRDADDHIKEGCLDDFRRGLCQAGHDFVFLTDHNESFSRTPFPDNLLYRPARGDALVERGGMPVASWAKCEDGQKALIMAGTESNTMPVGLERHVADTDDGAKALYGADTPEALEAFAQAGAVRLVAHTEDWTVDQLTGMALEGFEMYNVHANFFLNAGKTAEMVIALRKDDGPHPDLMLVPVYSEDERYLSTWASVLARGAKRVTTMGTDCHRNSLPGLAKDGERMDSYRRMMIWFSNHLLVRPASDGSYDDRDLKEALKGGRLYGSFDMIGYPEGFDYRAEVGSEVHEMGETVSLGASPKLVVKAPTVAGLGAGDKAPEVHVRILKAEEGSWKEVASGGADASFTPTEAGAYRAEVRMKPHHLEAHLGRFADVAGNDLVWVYGNAIYVEP